MLCFDFQKRHIKGEKHITQMDSENTKYDRFL